MPSHDHCDGDSDTDDENTNADERSPLHLESDALGANFECAAARNALWRSEFCAEASRAPFALKEMAQHTLAVLGWNVF